MVERLGSGEFFAIDRRSFAAACKIGLNAGVIYLVIARGTGRDHSTSRWSVNAIERHSGISRPKAKVGIQLLIEDQLIIRRHGGTRPEYTVVPWKEIVDRSGLIGPTVVEPEYIWLPNALIDGVGGEKSPIALVREMQNVRLLQLLVAMYDVTDLPNEGGIARTEIFAYFDRVKVGERGAVTVWGFEASSLRIAFHPGSSLAKLYGLAGDEDDPALTEFFEAVRSLQRVGLFTFIPHAFESDDPDAEILHAISDDSGEPWETELAAAAHEAGYSCLWPDKQRWVEQTDIRLLPVRSHIKNLTIMGIARLRYRPRTRMTAAWVGKSKESAEAFLELYGEISQAAAGQKASLQHKGELKRGYK